MTDITFTPNPQNYSITNFTQECETQVTPCSSLNVSPRKRRKDPKKPILKEKMDFSKIIYEMFEECALPRDTDIILSKPLNIAKSEQGIKTVAVKEKLTVKQLAFNMLSALSTSCQSIGRKLKKALTPKKKESAAEKRAKAIQLRLINHLLDLESVTLNEYVPEALYDELARLDAIIAQEKGL